LEVQPRIERHVANRPTQHKVHNSSFIISLLICSLIRKLL
jgi:hypothetical protein